MITNIEGIQPLVVVSSEGLASEAKDDSATAANSNTLQQAVDVRNEQRQQEAKAEAKKEESEQSEEQDKPVVDYTGISSRIQELLDENTAVKFSVDANTKEMVMTVFNRESDEVIRQVPTELALKVTRLIADYADDSGKGQVTDARV